MDRPWRRDLRSALVCTRPSAERRGRRPPRPRRRAARRPTRIRQDRHGLRRDRRARHLHPDPRRSQSPRRPVAHADRAVPRHPARPTRRRPAQAHRHLRHRLTAVAGQTRRHSHPHPQLRHVIVDECHHLGAAAYEHSVKRIAAQFWLGLTATPTRRDSLSQLVTWQLGPVRHTMTDEEQGTLAATMHADAGPRRVLFLHETDFKPRRRGPGRSGCAGRGTPEAGPRRVTQPSGRRRRRRGPDARAQLSGPHPAGRPRRSPHRHTLRRRTPGAGAPRSDERHQPPSGRRPPRLRQGR